MNQSSNQYRVGELRPSQILFTFGVGSVLDLPNLSVMVMGLDDWESSRAIEIGENRLLAAVKQELGYQVNRLLSPPIPPSDASQSNPFDIAAKVGIPVAPFPGWMVCPRCRLLAPLQSRFFELKNKPFRPDETRYVHKNCNRSQQPPTVVPARFLVACEKGHLDDFPWLYFVHRGNTECRGRLRLYEFGVSGSPTDIEVKCEECGATRRLSEGFGMQGKKNMPQCRGRHPHIRDFDDECKKQMRGILLGASNSWFPVTISALSIPTTSGKLAELVERNWTVLEKAPTASGLEGILQAFQAVGQLLDLTAYKTNTVWEEIENQRHSQGQDEEAIRDLKTPEWRVFSSANSVPRTSELEMTVVEAPKGYEPYFSQIVLVERLREVRALMGFTRIQSPGDLADEGEIQAEDRVRLSRNSPKWVPATEVKGEGIFLQFEETKVQQWEKQTTVKKYEIKTFEAHKRWCSARNLEPDKVRCPRIRYLLLHSFAHALMRQLSLECGYNAASLRERIYAKAADEENGPMAGILIYTSAPDSEGTLGGLVSLGKPLSLGHHIEQALEQMRLCASDPLCAEHDPLSGAPTLHWAACHACLFSPETSCERGNRYLDRSVLVETVTSPQLSFFS